MASMADHIQKMREERIAREKARLDKLRELNLKKYSNNELQQLKKVPSAVSVSAKIKPNVATVETTTTTSDTKYSNNGVQHLKKVPSAVSVSAKTKVDLAPGQATTSRSDTITVVKKPTVPNTSNNKKSTAPKTLLNKDGKNKSHNDKKLKPALEAPRSAVVKITKESDLVEKPKFVKNVENETNHEEESNINLNVHESKTVDDANDETLTQNSNGTNNQVIASSSKNTNPRSENEVKKSSLKPTVITHNVNQAKLVKSAIHKIDSRKSIAVIPKVNSKPKTVDRRKTMIPEPTAKSASTINTKESVFDRLYKPRVVHKQPPVDNVSRLKCDPEFFKKVVKQSEFITGRVKMNVEPKVRRSISAVHLKRVPKSELNNCMHKWASIGNNMNKEDVQNIHEGENLKEETIVSAVRSEKKRVEFKTPLPLNFNASKQEELHAKLQNWCKAKGKSIDSYHHLQCFGLHHLSNGLKPLDAPLFDDADENKENIALEHDSDNESFNENNNKNGNLDDEKARVSEHEWRMGASMLDSSDYNDSCASVMTCSENAQNDELFLGALNDLTNLVREGYDWEQCDYWRRAIRQKFKEAANSAQYWECRAALEEMREDLHATVECLEKALAMGTKQSVVEANLDSLLNKFIKLKISPSNGKKQAEIEPKLVDIKNVFKSTIIRFAVKQAKLHQSNGTPKYTVTPVRRSHRLSRAHTPLRVCATIQQAKEFGAEFRPNRALHDSP
ncbi:uncharacterized protein LOC112050906 [Bicyclus anynana]|uniref:Uncharacterized protein LOC112050906 n=1 Tax=Bicyclus anynana TaxID=110368 RepID=A0A6J1NPG5_BICAN|nr:uncharacterized protein LOC112050906 [Bicyclus anynana]